MGKKSVREYLNAIYNRYHKVSKKLKQLILDEFCATTGLNRKYVIRRLGDDPSKGIGQFGEGSAHTAVRPYPFWPPYGRRRAILAL